MKLTQPEIIQILRRRNNLNQGALGSAAFETSFASGRTKIKNIELGRQIPTPDDLEKMAHVLGVTPSDLEPSGTSSLPATQAGDGVLLQRPVLDRLPGTEAYLEMLNKAVRLDDRELIAHIADKLAGLFAELAQQSHSAGRASG